MMNITAAPILTYLEDTLRQMIEPRPTANAVRSVNASIMPKNTCSGAS